VVYNEFLDITGKKISQGPKDHIQVTVEERRSFLGLIFFPDVFPEGNQVIDV
jgi:hypothetical protein